MKCFKENKFGDGAFDGSGRKEKTKIRRRIGNKMVVGKVSMQSYTCVLVDCLNATVSKSQALCARMVSVFQLWTMATATTDTSGWDG